MKTRLLLCFVMLFGTIELTYSQTTTTIGTNSSSSSTRGPFQRSDTASTTVFSRFVQVYTQAELAEAGITSGSEISQVNWELASSNVIIGDGDATLKVYVKNSTATQAVEDSWENHIDGADLVFDQAFNTDNNFPGANGWMPFEFSQSLTYTGGAIEVLVDWDCSQVTTPAFSGDGAIKWRWTAVSPDFLVVKKTSSSAPSSNITDLRDERANIQFVYSEGASCPAAGGITASDVSMTGATISWLSSDNDISYNWFLLPEGGQIGDTPLNSGNSSMPSVDLDDLEELTSYGFYVQTECDGEVSPDSELFLFSTAAAATETIIIGEETSSSSTRGPFQRSDTASSTVYSRFVQTFTQEELADAGLTNDAVLTSVGWDLASENVMIGAGDATLKIYVKNSTSTEAVSDTWDNLIDGSELVSDNVFNTENNFPGEQGWMAFSFSSPVTYTGGALEVAVDWDCSQVSTPAFSGDGSLKWRWSSTAPDFLVAKRTSSSSPSTDISDLRDERANIQFGFASSDACAGINTSSTSNVTSVGCFGDTDGSIDLTVTDGEGPFEFLWSNGNEEEDLEGVAAGMYSVTITDVNGCPYEENIEITEPDQLALTAGNEDDVDGAGIGAASVSVAGGTEPYSYTWDGEEGTNELTELMTGAYTVMVTDANGCSASEEIFVDNVVGINEIEGEVELTVYPNPSAGLANLKLGLGQKSDVNITVYSFIGEIITQIEVENINELTYPIDVTSHSDGIYFIQVQIADKLFNQKLIYLN